MRLIITRNNQPHFFIMKNYPRVKFIFSKKKELETFLIFLNESKHRDNKRKMNWAFYNPHPKLKTLEQKNLNFLEKKLIVKKYIDVYYKENLAEIKRGILKTKKDWQSKEKYFFALVDKIFKNHLWPKGKYIAYSTIWGMYPRYLKDKTFQFPYCHKKKNFTLVVIAHEMLHFIFYDYFFTKHPQYKNHKYDFFVWHVSEIFNVVIQNSPKWIKAFQIKSMEYPEHKKIISGLAKKYYKKTDWRTDDLINDIIKAVKNSLIYLS
jgi:hypothetical protein